MGLVKIFFLSVLGKYFGIIVILFSAVKALLGGRFDGKLNTRALIIILMLSAIIGINSIGRLEYWKDFVLIAQVPLSIYLLANISGNVNKMMKTLVIFVVLIVIKDLFLILFNFDKLIALGLLNFQQIYQFNTPLSLIGIALIYPATRKCNLFLFATNINRLFLCIFVTHILLSTSRTMIVTALVMVFLPNKRSFRAAFFLILLVLPLLSGLLSTSFGISAMEGLAGKFLHSFEEISIGDQGRNLRDISKNWRGFESYLGLNEWAGSSPIHIFFGLGLGSYVEVPSWAFSGKVEGLDRLPFFHNGFITILLKAGLAGVLLLLYYFNSFFRIYKYGQNPFLTEVVTNVVLIIVFNTVFTHGLFKPTVAVALLYALAMVSKMVRIYD